ncbi:uncharacterized protein LOC132744178 [Ruditapes philippinarum]|uniref:uncharacterized protein LOC132744178 n=1 Tax=Ruditapes philippinarum TaxID=129788 RepID=UPI00295A909F|nr:uncharacterized protein LOC132744178 [Ruditapes philippinarum]
MSALTEHDLYCFAQNQYFLSLLLGLYSTLRRHRASAEDLKTWDWAKDQNLYCRPAVGVLTNAEGSGPTKSGLLKIGSTLTINSVRKEDVERTFICILASTQKISILASTQKIDGQMFKKVVRIFKKDKPLSPLGLGFTFGVPVFAVVILVLIYLLRTLYGPQIQLFCCSRIKFCGPKAIDNDEYSYNLFIYHAEDDETMAQNIKQFLSDKGYKVFIAADIEGNENIMHKVFEKTEHSALVVFLYSKDLREDDLANFFLQSMIRSRKGKRILILEVEAYKPKQIRQWHKKHAENIRVLHEQYINEQDRNIEIGTDVSEEMGDDLQFWKILPSIKVPNLDQKGRKLRNFRCALQNKIPKFDHQKQRKGMEQQIEQRHSSSERPLLYSTSESETLTPQCITNNAGEFSPSSNEVFTFEQETNLSGHDKIIDDNRKALASSTNDIRSDNCDVRGELSGDRGNDLIHAVVCNNHENHEYSVLMFIIKIMLYDIDIYDVMICKTC